MMSGRDVDVRMDVEMQVARLHGVRDLRLETAVPPKPGPGEVLLRMAAVGVCGSDVHYYLEGRIGSQVVTAPLILGHEFSGWVAALGEGVEGLAPGMLVAVDPAIPCGICEPCQFGNQNLCPRVRFCGTPPIDGVYAEYAVMPAENCFPLPEGFDPADAAMLEPLGIAIHAVDLAKLKPGHTVAVLGAGPIGLLTAAVAKAGGASRVLMTEPLAYRRALAQRYIADTVIDPEAVDAPSEILRLTAGRGVDVAFEAAGAAETPQEAAEAVRPGGRVILIGIPADDTLNFNHSTVRHKGLTIKLSRRMKHTYPRAIRLVESGRVDVRSLISHRHPLGDIGRAFEQVAGYSDGVVRAVIDVNTS